MSNDPGIVTSTAGVTRAPTIEMLITSPEMPDKGEGLLPYYIRKVFGRSWKTSALGWLSIVVGLVPLIPDAPTWLTKTAAAITTLLIGTGLMASKQTGVSGEAK